MIIDFTRVRVKHELMELLAAARKELDQAEAARLVARMLVDSLLRKIDET